MWIMYNCIECDNKESQTEKMDVIKTQEYYHFIMSDTQSNTHGPVITVSNNTFVFVFHLAFETMVAYSVSFVTVMINYIYQTNLIDEILVQVTTISLWPLHGFATVEN